MCVERSQFLLHSYVRKGVKFIDMSLNFLDYKICQLACMTGYQVV